MKNSKDIQEWLNSCPLPVLDTVVDEPNRLKHIVSTHFVYEKPMLVVINLHELKDLFKR